MVVGSLKRVGVHRVDSRSNSVGLLALTGETAIKKSYHTIEKRETRKIAEYLSRNGDIFLPMLELIEGASENSAAVTSLLESLVERGIDPECKYLFVIDGSKVLRFGIDKVFGTKNRVERRRNHKIKNVCDKLQEDLKEQVKSVMKGAFRLSGKNGFAKLKEHLTHRTKPHDNALYF